MRFLHKRQYIFIKWDKHVLRNNAKKLTGIGTNATTARTKYSFITSNHVLPCEILLVPDYTRAFERDAPLKPSFELNPNKMIPITSKGKKSENGKGKSKACILHER